MKKINKLLWIYLTGFFLILALPLLNLPPWFSPPSWGKTIIFRSILAIMLFLYIAQTFIRRKFVIKTSRVFYILLGLLGIFGLATIFSADRVFSFFGSPYRSGGFLNFASYIIFAILAFLILRKSDWSKILNFSLIVGGFVSLIAIFQNFGLIEKIFIKTNEPWSTIGGSTFLAIYLLFLVFISLTFAIKSIKNLDRGWFFYLPILLLFIFVIFLTISRATYIGLFIGLLYFFFAYPSSGKRLKRLKIALLVLAGLAIIFVAYVNLFPSENASQRIKKLSIERALDDPRVAVWRISSQAIASKPLLGYGPENFSIAFDQHYDSNFEKIQMISGTSIPSSWYDRAHNVIFEIGSTAGLPALIIYLALFFFLFKELRSLKKEYSQDFLIPHGLQAIFIAYFISIFFGFDVFDTYLLFFLLIAYSMFLITENYPEKTIKIDLKIFRYSLILILLIGTIAFIWIYNIKPFQVNVEINTALHSKQKSQMELAIQKMEKILPTDTFLNGYLRSNYLDIINSYIIKDPSKIIVLAPKGIELLNESLEIRPNYTRYWLLLGTYYNLMLENYQNVYPEYVEDWKNNATKAFEKTSELSPNRQETYIRWAKMYALVNELEMANEKIGKCIELNPTLGDCYWIKALIKFKEQNVEEAKANIKLAEDNGYNINHKQSLLELRKMYYYLDNYNDYISEFCDINIKLHNKDIYNLDYSIKTLACYIKQGKNKEAIALADHLKIKAPEYTDVINDLMKHLK